LMIVNSSHNCTILQYLKEATMMKLSGVFREIVPSPQQFQPHTTPEAVSLGMFCHLPYSLYLSTFTSTFQVYWRSTFKENVSNMMTR
jgi:hypothetical protein